MHQTRKGKQWHYGMKLNIGVDSQTGPAHSAVVTAANVHDKHLFMATPSQLKCYNPRHPERTLLCQTVAEHYETWLDQASAGQFDGQGDPHSPKPYVRKAFEKYLECGIFAQGFARARCNDCGHDFLVAFSCKGRGICPSCNTRRMAETAAYLTDHVFPRLPARQWVLSVPKRLRYFMQRNGAVLGMVLRIFLEVRGHRANAASQQPVRGACEQGGTAHWRRRLHPPLRLQSERACALPCLRGRWGV